MKAFFLPIVRQLASKQKSILKLGIALLGLTLWQAKADETTTLGIHTFSYHNSGNYNDITPGLYVEKNNYVVGAYHNSIRQTSVYAGYTWTWPLPTNPLFQSVAFTGGLVTGYRHRGYNSDIAILVATSLRHDIDERQTLRLSILPLHKSSTATYVLHLSYETKFK